MGMGKEIYDTYPVARALFERADQILGFSVTKLCFEGPESELNLTINAQPAIFTTSLAIWEVIKLHHADLQPSATCGLSLGEFSALVAARALSFEEGLKLVRKRGEWMHEAGSKNPGTMCSVVGLDEKGCEAVAEACGVQIANYNSPEQIVLSGNKQGIEKAMALAKEKGAKKVIPLKVSGAFHSKLMDSVQSKLAGALPDVKLLPPQIEFIPNVTASFVNNIEEIRAHLAKQVTHSVRWTQTLRFIRDKGLRLALEMGPGKVLKGLAKRILEDFTVHSVESPADIHGVLSFLNEAAVR